MLSKYRISLDKIIVVFSMILNINHRKNEITYSQFLNMYFVLKQYIFFKNEINFQLRKEESFM